MTESRRPWWMLHWPSWVALAMFGGSSTALSVIGVYGSYGFGTTTVAHGWPRRFAERASVPMDKSEWPPEFADFRQDPDAVVMRGVPKYWTFRAVRVTNVNWHSFILDLAIGFGILLGSLHQSEKYFRRTGAMLTIRSFFVIVAVLGAGCVTCPYMLAPYEHYARFRTEDIICINIRNISLFIVAIPIGLSCLTLLDLLGFVYSRFTRKPINE